jgi:malonate transporter and related proteins
LRNSTGLPIVHSLQLIGQAAGGAALFVTGVILSAQSVLFSRNVISGAILKNVVHPLIGYALILVLPMSSETARAAVLLLALPSGFFGVLFGLRYSKDSHEAGSTLIVSSLASIVTLTIALVLTADW